MFCFAFDFFSEVHNNQFLKVFLHKIKHFSIFGVVSLDAGPHSQSRGKALPSGLFSSDISVF